MDGICCTRAVSLVYFSFFRLRYADRLSTRFSIFTVNLTIDQHHQFDVTPSNLFFKCDVFILQIKTFKSFHDQSFGNLNKKKYIYINGPHHWPGPWTCANFAHAVIHHWLSIQYLPEWYPVAYPVAADSEPRDSGEHRQHTRRTVTTPEERAVRQSVHSQTPRQWPPPRSSRSGWPSGPGHWPGRHRWAWCAWTWETLSARSDSCRRQSSSPSGGTNRGLLLHQKFFRFILNHLCIFMSYFLKCTF